MCRLRRGGIGCLMAVFWGTFCERRGCSLRSTGSCRDLALCFGCSGSLVMDQLSMVHAGGHDGCVHGVFRSHFWRRWLHLWYGQHWLKTHFSHSTSVSVHSRLMPAYAPTLLNPEIVHLPRTSRPLLRHLRTTVLVVRQSELRSCTTVSLVRNEQETNTFSLRAPNRCPRY